MFANTDRRQRDDELMAAAHAEYMDWLTGIETFEDPDDPTDADTTVMTGVLTPDEIFWITEEELYRQDRAAVLAELY